MFEHIKQNILIFLNRVLDYYFINGNKINLDKNEIDLDNKIFLICLQCKRIYTLKYFLTDICIFCLDDNIKNQSVLRAKL